MIVFHVTDYFYELWNVLTAEYLFVQMIDDEAVVIVMCNSCRLLYRKKRDNDI